MLVQPAYFSLTVTKGVTASDDPRKMAVAEFPPLRSGNRVAIQPKSEIYGSRNAVKTL
jgi:hypothetical protein